MKKSMVLRLLSCCLAGILLVETPIQVAAAPEDAAESVAEEPVADTKEEELVEPGTDPAREEVSQAEETMGEVSSQEETAENRDDSEAGEGVKTEQPESGKDTETGEDSRTEENPGTEQGSGTEENPGTGQGSGTKEEPDTGKESGTREEPDGEEGSGIKEETDTKEEPGDEEAPGTEEDSEPEGDSGLEEKTGSLTLTGLQYGTFPEYSEAFDAEAASEMISGLAEALADGEAQVSEYALSPDMLKDLLTWIVNHEEEYYSTLPGVEYTYVEEEKNAVIRTVTVSRIQEEDLLLLSPVCREQNVEISFTGAEGLEEYRLFQISEDEIREFPAEEGQMIRISREESDDPLAYQYVLCGYRTVENERKLQAFSKCVKAEYEPETSADSQVRPAEEITISSLESETARTAVTPGRPVLMSVINKDKATLTWKAVDGADGYILYQYVDGAYKEIDRTDDRAGSEFTHVISDLKFNETRRYAVTAYVNNDTAGQTITEGEKSNMVDVFIGFENIELKASVVNCKEISLSWNSSFGADGYEIKRSDWAEAVKVESGNTLTYNDTSVQPNKTYVYQIRPYQVKERDTAGRPVQYIFGDWSNSVSAAPVFPAVGSVDVKAVDYRTLQITWSTVDGAAGYRVYRSTSKDGSYKEIANLTSGAANSCEDTGRKPGVTCYYKVRPYCVVGGQIVEGPESSIKSGKTKMDKVAGVKTESASYTSVKISWGKVAGASGYKVYYSTSKDSGYKKLKTTSSTSYTHKSLTPGKTYYYKVRAYKTVNGKKVYGDYSKPVKAKVAPAVVVAEVSTVSYSSVTLGWKKVSGASGYVLYRSDSKDGDWTKIKTVKASSKRSYKDTGLVSGKTYYYKIRAYRTVSGKKVYGAYSEPVKAKPELKKPSLKKSTATYDSIKLTWKKISGASGYDIYRSTSADGSYKRVKRIKSASTLSYTDSGLATGTTYYYKIRAYRTVGEKKGYSAYSKPVDVLLTLEKVADFKAAPTGDEDKGTVELKWSKVAGATGYSIERSTSKKGTYKEVKSIDSGDTLSCTNSGLTFGETYYYRICAVRDGYKGPVTDPVKAIAVAVSLSDSSFIMSVGDVEKLAVAVMPKAKVTWSSSDENVVTVDSKGKVTAVGGGTAKIHVKVSGIEITKSVDVTVKGAAKGTTKGIDVSSYQGQIDWKKVAADGVDFAMIRVITGSSSSTVRDTRFKENYDGAKNNGVKVGLYRYSYATSRSKARNEANAILDTLHGRKLDYPIVMDMEDKSILEGTNSNARRSEIILAFKKEIEDAGYEFALYANQIWLNNYLDMDMLKDVDIWIARWREPEKGHGYNGKGNVIMWQYSSTGRVDGINGNVDMNLSYRR